METKPESPRIAAADCTIACCDSNARRSEAVEASRAETERSTASGRHARKASDVLTGCALKSDLSTSIAAVATPALTARTLALAAKGVAIFFLSSS